MEKVIKHVAEQVAQNIKIPPWAKQDDIISQAEELKKSNQWEFRSITPDDFIATMKSLTQMVKDLEKEPGKLNKTPSDVLCDRAAYRTVDMLKCIQTMEFEATQRRIFAIRGNFMSHGGAELFADPSQSFASFSSVVDHTRGTSFYERYHPRDIVNERLAVPETQTTTKMFEFIRWAKDELYKHSDDANFLIESLYPAAETKPISLSEENEKSYAPSIAIAHTNKVTREHEEAFAQVVKSFDDVLKYGLPSETSIGKFIDRLLPHRDEIKGKNEELIKNLLSKEMDIETIETFIVPALRMRAFEMEMQSNVLNMGMFDVGFSTYTSDPNGPHRVYNDAIKTIEQMIKDTRAREAKMAQSTTLTITRGDDDVYTISIARSKGEKREVKFNDQDVTKKEITERNRFSEERKFRLGRLSKELREEKKVYSMKLLGSKEEVVSPTNNPKKSGEVQKLQKESSIGELSISTTKTTKSHGKVAARLNMAANAVRLEGKVIKSYKAGRKTEEQNIIGGKAEIVGASISAAAPTKDYMGTHKVSAEAHPVKVGANYRGVNASINTGPSFSAGMQVTAEDISKKAAKALVDELLKGSSANFTRVIDDVMSMIKAIPPSADMDWGSIKISAATMDLLNTQIDVQRNQESNAVEVSHETHSPLIDDIKNDIESIEPQIQELYNDLSEVDFGNVANFVLDESTEETYGVDSLHDQYDITDDATELDDQELDEEWEFER